MVISAGEMLTSFSVLVLLSNDDEDDECDGACDDVGDGYAGGTSRLTGAAGGSGAGGLPTPSRDGGRTGVFADIRLDEEDCGELPMGGRLLRSTGGGGRSAVWSKSSCGGADEAAPATLGLRKAGFGPLLSRGRMGGGVRVE